MRSGRSEAWECLRRCKKRALGPTLVAVGLAAACSGGQKPPPNHPIAGMSDRVRSRIDRIELVIPDRDRAKKVTEAYVVLEDLVLEYQASRATSLAALAALDGEEKDVAASTDKIFDRAKAAEDKLFERYVEVQVQIRALVTAEEFRKIDALR